MLVLVRKKGEEILIGPDIVVSYLGDEGKDRIRIGVSAPPGVEVDRREVRERKEKSRAEKQA